jgi:hypothetical protein
MEVNTGEYEEWERKRNKPPALDSIGFPAKATSLNSGSSP